MTNELELASLQKRTEIPGLPPPLTKAQVLTYLYQHPAVVPKIALALDWRKNEYERLLPYSRDGKISERSLTFRPLQLTMTRQAAERLVLDRLFVAEDRGEFRVAFPDITAEALTEYIHQQRAAQEARQFSETALPAGADPGLFGNIVGYEAEKRIITMVLNGSKANVHVLLSGPPSCGKTIFLEDLATLPGACYRFADQTSKVGLRDLMLGGDPPRYLILDELDKMDRSEISTLNEILESQRSSVLKSGRNEEKRVDVKCFAAANEVRKLPPEIVSKFWPMRFSAYTQPEFLRVAEHYLVHRGAERELAKFIAQGVSAVSLDIRDARRVFDLANSVEDARWLVEQLKAGGALH